MKVICVSPESTIVAGVHMEIDINSFNWCNSCEVVKFCKDINYIGESKLHKCYLKVKQ